MKVKGKISKLAFFLGRDLLFVLFLLVKILFSFFFFFVESVFLFSLESYCLSWLKVSFHSFINSHLRSSPRRLGYPRLVPYMDLVQLICISMSLIQYGYDYLIIDPVSKSITILQMIVNLYRNAQTVALTIADARIKNLSC